MKLSNPVVLHKNAYHHALNAIHHFENEAAEESHFLYGLPKSKIVRELLELVHNPHSFHPGIDAKLSGDAVIISQYILKYMPDIYVGVILDLYKMGKASFNNGHRVLELQPSINICKWACNNDKNEFAMSTAQLFLFTIREYFNEIDYFCGAENTVWASSFLQNIWSLNTLSVQQKITEILLGVKCHQFVKRNCQEKIEKIQHAIDNKHIIVLMVNKKYLTPNQSKIQEENNEQTNEHFIGLLKLNYLNSSLLNIKWWERGVVYAQDITETDFNNMFKGGFFIPNPSKDLF